MACTGKCKSEENLIKINEDVDGDVWASDDENVNDYADRQRAQVNQGYLDGITNAQELGLQNGFDEGYPKGAELGIRVGRVLATLYGTDKFEEAKKELNISKVLDRQHYNDQLDLEEADHPLVVFWEKQAGITQ